MIFLGPIKSASTLRLVSTGSNEIQQLRWNSSLGRVRKLQHTSDIFKTRIKQMPEVAKGVAGERYTIADITAMVALGLGAAVGLTVDPGLAHLTRWYGEVSARPSARA